MSPIHSRGARLGLLSLAHLFNDWYMNLIQTLLPFLVAAGLAVGKGAFLVSAFMISSSLLQPFFGYLVDRKGQRWLVYAGTLWMALLLAPFGLVENYWGLLALAAFSGLGTCAFHPQASSMVSASASPESKGFQQSLFVTAGNIGWSLTPLMAAPLVARFGLGCTPCFVIPGLFVALALWLSLEKGPKADSPSASPLPGAPLLEVFRREGGELSKLVLVVALRSLAYVGFVTFLPLLLRERHAPVWLSGLLVFAMLFAGALGGLFGGRLSDRVGRKPVIVASLALASPLLLLFPAMGEGFLAFVVLALGGAALLASFSVTVVFAQERVGRNAAMASGLMLGFGIGIGGLGVGLIGKLAEYTSVLVAVQTVAWAPLLAACAACFLMPSPADSKLAR